eukprot:1200831-Amphidinium_carterae.1
MQRSSLSSPETIEGRGPILQLMLAIARMWHRTSARSKWPGLFMHLGAAIDALLWQVRRLRKQAPEIDDLDCENRLVFVDRE